ncbi:O-antigen ligase [Curtobacterium sp. MCBD17_023]|uniref:O-antigen ligase family protein n=1 Tax=Curtobacterium sp. MCBD17_023 TaxID=2175657 RepID=UPI000D8B5E36|nr:O-antigen ligase family protein [Curtobacterium sp. MCBD17_023]PYY48281.1 hypothetical protein DEI84_09845 [Curtobacterium sp. MCBD17_023]
MHEETDGIEHARSSSVIVVLAAVVGVLAGATSELHLGPASASAVITATAAGSCIALAPMLVGSGHLVPTPAVLFVALAFGRAVFAPSSDGLQNVAAYAILLLVPAFVARRVDPIGAERALRWFTVAGLAATALFAAQHVLGFLTDGVRSYALAALPLLAAAVALRSGPLPLRAAPLVVTLGIVASLSRTASVVAILMLVALVTRRPRGRRTGLAVVAVSVATAGFIALYSFVPSFAARFSAGDNASVGGVTINTSGRAKIWAAVADHARSAPLLGHGPGSAAQLVTDTFIEVRQPHNDWLRLLHDTGWIGVSLFALAMVTLLVRIGSAARATDRPVHWAALSALLALLATAVTDNTLIYPFAIGSTAVLVGLSLGTAPRRGTAPADLPVPSASSTNHTEGTRP